MNLHSTFQICNMTPGSRLGFHILVFLIRKLFLILFSFKKNKYITSDSKIVFKKIVFQNIKNKSHILSEKRIMTKMRCP